VEATGKLFSFSAMTTTHATHALLQMDITLMPYMALLLFS